MKKIICLMLSLLVLLTSCGEVYRYTSDTYFAMNTVMTVISENKEIHVGIYKDVTECENNFSRTLENSEIYKLNENTNAVLSDTTLYMLEKALQIAKDTDYAFNPCMGSLSDLWDITSGKNVVPDSDSIKTALEKCGADKVVVEGNTVTVPEGMKIDFGGVAKGYTAQLVIDKHKDKNLCVNLGGNVAVNGSSQSNRDKNGGWNVGITNPFDNTKTVGTLNLSFGFVSISGAYERFFEKDGKVYHHIFDPKTGYPADSGLASVAVISQDGLLADALSTALFVMGKNRAEAFYKQGKYDFDVIMVSNDGFVYVSEGIYESFSFDNSAVDKNSNKLKLVVI